MQNINKIKKFCLFVGPGRSGHSLIANILNAHPNVYISDEVGLFKNNTYAISKKNIVNKIMKRYNSKGNRIARWGGYRYDIEKKWDDAELLVVGDKHANNTTISLTKKFSKLKSFEKTIEIPVVYIHSIRNPYDVITTISKRKNKKIDNVIIRYGMIMGVVDKIKKSKRNLLEIKHESLIENKEAEIKKMCNFIGINIFDGFVESCSKVIYDKPHLSRIQYEKKWNSTRIKNVEKIIKQFDFLHGYSYE